MDRFSQLIESLDQTNSTNEKTALMEKAFREAVPGEAAWMLFFLSGRKLKGVVKRAVLHEAALEEAGVPEWLYDECREAVGDSAETIALLLPGPGSGGAERLDQVVEGARGSLASAEPEEQKRILKESWRRQSTRERFVFNKILTGGFRVGVSQELVLRAAAAALEAPQPVVARRLMGEWEPSAAFWQSLSSPEEDEGPRPYPFGLAHPLPELAALGNPDDWTAEWKWDGIRCQAAAGGGQLVLWSRGEEALNESFPDVAAALGGLPPGSVVDGEILAADFASLQKRLGRKAPSKKLLAEIPCRFLAFDVLALGSEDLRARPWVERRHVLESLGLETGELLCFSNLEELGALRDRASAEGREGLMIKRKDAPYPAGRRTGVWWKWKVAPRTVDAVLVYAQSGSGRRAGLFTDYTFALWKEGALVPFAKAYSGLTDAEIKEVDRVIRATTLEKHGPVRVVQPTLVFEIAFEGVQKSSRHKSGLAVRFPRIAAWRRDKKPEDADTVDAVWAEAGEAISDVKD